jgi:hypothetical protein
VAHDFIFCLSSKKGVDKVKKLDMSKYKPYMKMGRTCETREIKKKRVVWPMEITERELSGGQFKVRVLGKRDIDKAAELWRESYPEVYGSQHEWILFPEEYEGKVALKENWQDDSVNKMYAMFVCEEIKTGKLSMATMFTKFDQNLHIEASFFAIHPDYRKGKHGFDIWAELSGFYRFMKDTGAEYLTVFCETWQSITQYVWFKQMGWKVAGIFPGNFTRWSGGQEEYRGCTVYFYRLINEGARYSTKPEEWQLLPEMNKLWECLEEINKDSDDEALRKGVSKT